ncbi:hypothetical protein O6P43_009809 [Quillaja saponaria]|uniref:Uncharacterized protein n=1 Tax=Quillaja saponaria TaxID=32244 RepID=A0AAD7VDI4_QUISA|nr:hypothetical protein O6P43_009809 [Quillaja saponaria]
MRYLLAELLLKVVNNILVHLKGLGENLRRDGRVGSKYSVGYGNDPWILAAEKSKGNCIAVTHIQLKVNQANWEYKHISLV